MRGGDENSASSPCVGAARGEMSNSSERGLTTFRLVGAVDFDDRKSGLREGAGSGASTSRVNVSGKSSSNGKSTVTSTRTALSPTQKVFGDNASMHPSMRSGTPYSQASRSTSRILATASWSEAAEEELVSNLGARERTRQEVLWEIVASEERQVYQSYHFPPFLQKMQICH